MVTMGVSRVLSFVTASLRKTVVNDDVLLERPHYEMLLLCHRVLTRRLRRLD
jgi:hypothetical protein